jgi:hypothetical protein
MDNFYRLPLHGPMHCECRSRGARPVRRSFGGTFTLHFDGHKLPIKPSTPPPDWLESVETKKKRRSEMAHKQPIKRETGGQRRAIIILQKPLKIRKSEFTKMV